MATAASIWLFAEGGSPLLSTVGIGLALPLLWWSPHAGVVPAGQAQIEVAQQTCG